MANALSVSRIVGVTANLQPLAAQRRGFGTLLILGDSDVIGQGERLRVYTSVDAVAADFGLTAPEYYGAALYFGQSPKPKELMIGRWAANALPALLQGGVLSTTEKTLANWTQIDAGGFTIDIDGTTVTVSEVDLSSVTNLNQVASAVTAKLGTAGSCSWDGNQFSIVSATTGDESTVGYAADTADSLASLMKLTSETAASVETGVNAETPAECVALCADRSSAWYGVTFCATNEISDDMHLAVAAYVEAAGKARLYGITTQDSRVLSATVDTDIGSRLKALGYRRTPWLYSASNKYAICSLFGRAFTVNFSGNRTTITLMFKQLPGVVYENLTESQAQALEAKNGNVFAYFDNDTAILMNGVMPSGAYFDEVHGVDWLADAIQVALYNLLYQSKTKVPQTNEGIGLLTAAASRVLDQAVANGLVAPGIWNADGFGQLSQGDRLDSGYYIYMPDIYDQD
ncbi:MAG: DUF3383 domain-containing protein, partial [Clostridia bacterium]|nr:DUF3383 domain-containing protein [Clostridia bacterium]